MVNAVLFTLALAGPPAAESPVAPRSASETATRDLSPVQGRLPDFRGLDLEGDGRRTLGQLPRNLGRSFAGVFARDNALPLLIGAAAAGYSSSFDQRARSGMGGVAPGLSSAASTAGAFKVMLPATIGLFAAGRLAEGGRFRAFTYDATQAVIVNGVYTTALKSLTTRTRPDGSDRLSFPSGHTSTAFAWATVAQSHYGWKVGAPSYLAAATIGFSRISKSKHHLSDVLAGAALGYVTGKTVVRVNGKVPSRKATFSLHPSTDATGGGVGVGASFSW
jgi:membrane-associated phospholipid phosphatase